MSSSTSTSMEPKAAPWPDCETARFNIASTRPAPYGIPICRTQSSSAISGPKCLTMPSSTTHSRCSGRCFSVMSLQTRHSPTHSSTALAACNWQSWRTLRGENAVGRYSRNHPRHLMNTFQGCVSEFVLCQGTTLVVPKRAVHRWALAPEVCQPNPIDPFMKRAKAKHYRGSIRMADKSRLSLNQITTANWSVGEAVEACAHHGVPSIALWRHKIQEAGLASCVRHVQDAGMHVSDRKSTRL